MLMVERIRELMSEQNIKQKDLNALLKENGLQVKNHMFVHMFHPYKSRSRRIDSCSLITTSTMIV